jgi:hypothetical protein
MYQINLRAQASKLVSLTARWQIARVQRSAAPRRRAAYMRAALAELAKLAALRVIPGSAPDLPARPDPRDPCNW